MQILSIRDKYEGKRTINRNTTGCIYNRCPQFESTKSLWSLSFFMGIKASMKKALLFHSTLLCQEKGYC